MFFPIFILSSDTLHLHASPSFLLGPSTLGFLLFSVPVILDSLLLKLCCPQILERKSLITWRGQPENDQCWSFDLNDRSEEG